MLFETRIFKNIEGFDKNIFLYYEENDYFHKCNNLNLKLYLIRNCFFYHSKKGDSSSAIYKNSKEKFYSYLIGGWHGQWSKFYYLKKYHGFIYAIMKCLPNLIVNYNYTSLLCILQYVQTHTPPVSPCLTSPVMRLSTSRVVTLTLPGCPHPVPDCQ